MTLIKNYLYSFTYQILLMVLPIVTLPYITRVLGAHDLGINAYIMSICSYFIMFAILGLNNYAKREIAYVRDDKIKLNKTFWEIQLLSILTTSIAYFVFVIYVFYYGKYTLFFLICSITIIANIFDFSWLFIGLEKFKSLTIRSVIVKILSVILIFAFVKTKDDLAIYMLINALSVLISNLALVPFIKEVGFIKDIKSLKLTKHLKYSLIFLIPQVSISLYTIVNKIMLGVISNVTDVAFFDSADKIVRLTFSVLMSLSTVLMPVIANKVASGKISDIKEIIKKSFSFSLMAALPMMTGLMAISHNLIPLFLGTQYKSVGSVVFLESLIILPMAVANIVGNQYLFPMNKIKVYNFSLILGSIVNLILNVPFIYFFGVLGAAFTAFLSELVVAIAQVSQIRKFMSLKYLFEDWYKYSFAAILMFIVVFIEQWFLKGWLGIIIGITIGIITYILILIIMKVNSVEVISESVIKRFKLFIK